MDLQENPTSTNWLSAYQLSDGSVDNYVHDKTGLIDNLQKLMAKCISLINNKTEGDFDEVDTWISSFAHHLAVHTVQNGVFYPLADNYVRFKAAQPQANEAIIGSFIKILDRNAKSCFIAMCGFQIETILKKIAQKHNIELKYPMRAKFDSVLTYFAVSGKEDKLNLVDIFYWTRNTLHNGGLADRSVQRSYKRHLFVFKAGEDMQHGTWDYLTYFVNEIIGLFEEILHTEKYKN